MRAAIEGAKHKDKRELESWSGTLHLVQASVYLGDHGTTRVRIF